jgi:glycerol-3-phosphate acyltransferase PlsY
MVRLLGLLVGAYLLGSIPSGLWLGRVVAGVDVRMYGSHRTGATNVQRSLGTAAGLVVLGLDVAKGFVAVWAVSRITGSDYQGALAGVTAIVGHVLPVFADFRGGRGVATAAGAMLAVAPLAFLITLVLMVAVIGTTRYVSLGSIVAAVTGALWIAALHGHTVESDGALLLAVPGAAIVLFKHSDNLHRLLNGSESRLGRTASSQPV